MNNVSLGRIAFIDLEASSLDSASFPTEIGWRSSTRMARCLIKPPAKWTIYRNAWSAASERLIGITREMLDPHGVPPAEAVRRFLDAIGDRDLFSDEPDFDAHWLGMLAEAAGTSIGGPNLGHARKLIQQVAGGPPQHRAEADARRLALTLARQYARSG